MLILPLTEKAEKKSFIALYSLDIRCFVLCENKFLLSCACLRVFYLAIGYWILYILGLWNSDYCILSLLC